MELKHYLIILRRWGWVMLLCIVAAGVASYWLSSKQPRIYEAEARYLVGPAINHPNVNLNDLRASSMVGKTYAELATSRPIIQGMLEKLRLNADVDAISRQVNTTWIDTTQILNIRVRAADPEVAAAIANTLGDVIIERSPSGPTSLQAARREEATLQIQQLKANINATEAEIAHISDQIEQATDELAQRVLLVRLEQQRTQLAAAQQALIDQYAIVQNNSTNQITVLEPAVPELTPIAPDVKRNVMAAFIAGLVFGLAAMLLCEYFTNVIYTPEELRKATGLAYLGGIISRRKQVWGNDSSELVVQAHPETLAAESYRILRTNLHTAGNNAHPSVLLITSPSRGDGKSEVAANLAISFAQAGKRVILIDANLRQPRIAKLFGISEHIGLSNLLDTPDQKVAPVQIESIPGLSVLPAGAPALSSSEILGSQGIVHLLQELKPHADLIILDSPPLVSSDALSLAPRVDGVLLVVSRGTTDRENTVKAVESLRLVGARLVGAVLNRVKAGPAYSYYPSHAMKRPAQAFARTAAIPAFQDGSNVDETQVPREPDDTTMGSSITPAVHHTNGRSSASDDDKAYRQ